MWCTSTATTCGYLCWDLTLSLSHKTPKDFMRACVDRARVHVETDFTWLYRFRLGINKCMTLCNPNRLQVRLSEVVLKVSMSISRFGGFIVTYGK